MTYLLPPKSLRTLENDKLNNKNITKIQGMRNTPEVIESSCLSYFSIVFTCCVCILLYLPLK